MAFIDGTVVNLALPAFQNELGATITEAQWIIEIYILLLSALLLVGGSLGDIYGRCKIFSGGIIVFALASIWCGLSPDVTHLISARALQGIGGALLVPGSLAIISSYFPKETRGKAIGIWSAATSIMMLLGPVFGGWLIENLSWHWIFFINIPLAIIVLAIVYTRIPETCDTGNPKKIDWLGVFFATTGLGMLTFGLIESSNLGLSHPIVISACAVGIALLLSFIYVEHVSNQPMMPLHLFHSKSFSGANLLTFFLYGALAAELFFLPLNLIQVQGYTATEAGAAFIPVILFISLLSPWAGGLVARIGSKTPLTIGSLVCAVSYLLLAYPGANGSFWVTFFPGVSVLGIGMGLVVAPLTTTVMNSVSTDKAGIASGINNAISRAAGLFAIALLGVGVIIVFSDALEKNLSALELPKDISAVILSQKIKLAAIDISSVSGAIKIQLKNAIYSAFVDSFRWCSYICAVLAAMSALVAFVSIDYSPKSDTTS